MHHFLQFIARAEKENDGLEMVLPVLPYGVENFIAEQKVFADNQSEWSTRLKLDADARSELAEMQVSFTAGVIPSIVETLPYLIQYPYGCVEQTLSTFLPAIWAHEAAQKIGLKLPVKAAQMKDITDAGLKKLYGYQHGDGGWGWCGCMTWPLFLIFVVMVIALFFVLSVGMPRFFSWFKTLFLRNSLVSPYGKLPTLRTRRRRWLMLFGILTLGYSAFASSPALAYCDQGQTGETRTAITPL